MTTTPKPVWLRPIVNGSSVWGVMIASRHDDQDELRLLATVIARLTPWLRRNVKCIWCDSKAGSCFIVEMLDGCDHPDLTRGLAVFVAHRLCELSGGYNAIYVGKTNCLGPHWLDNRAVPDLRRPPRRPNPRSSSTRTTRNGSAGSRAGHDQGAHQARARPAARPAGSGLLERRRKCRHPLPRRHHRARVDPPVCRAPTRLGLELVPRAR